MQVQSETLDTLREPVAVFGTDGRLKFANRAFAQVWRITPEMLEVQPHIDQVIAACRTLSPAEEPWTQIREAVTGLVDARHGLTCRLALADGTMLDCAAEPLPDGATLLTHIDVTASVNVERALTDKNEALERTTRLRDEFVHHVSYELRSPLTNIIGFTELLGDETVGALNPRQREYADHIMRSSAALLVIINDILDLASIDAGSMELTRERVDVQTTIARGGAGHRRPAGGGRHRPRPRRAGRHRQLRRRRQAHPPDPVQPPVQRGRLLGPGPAGAGLRPQGRREPGAGGGRPGPRHAARGDGAGLRALREPYAGHPPRGVGLGLSIVRSFVELHGGRIDIASAPGTGTRVTCTFPVGDGEAPPGGGRIGRAVRIGRARGSPRAHRRGPREGPGKFKVHALSPTGLAPDGPVSEDGGVDQEGMAERTPWEIVLPDESATEDLGRFLAEILRPGDLVALSGGLGGGKTTLARAIIRDIVGDPGLEVPSPTFTLVQPYEGRNGQAVVHADLYRLRGPDELVELGFDELTERAIALVEWPTGCRRATARRSPSTSPSSPNSATTPGSCA